MAPLIESPGEFVLVPDVSAAVHTPASVAAVAAVVAAAAAAAAAAAVVAA